MLAEELLLLTMLPEFVQPDPAPASFVESESLSVFVMNTSSPTSTVVFAPVIFPLPTRQRSPREAIGVGIVTSSIVRQDVVLSWYIRFQAPTLAPEFNPCTCALRVIVFVRAGPPVGFGTEPTAVIVHL